MKHLIFIILIFFVSCRTTALYNNLSKEIDNIKLGNVDTLVDIGCGDNFFDKIIINKYPNLFLILEDLQFDLRNKDIEKQVKKRLKNSSYEPNIESKYKFVIGNTDSIPLPSETYKRVLCRRTFHEFANPEKMAKELVRILAIGGTLVIMEAEPKYDGHKDNFCKKTYLTKTAILKYFTSLQLTNEAQVQYDDVKANVLCLTK